MFCLSANDVIVSQKVPMENESSRISWGRTIILLALFAQICAETERHFESVLELENATLNVLIESLFLTGVSHSIVQKGHKTNAK